jgi:hypothetical protein
MLLGIEDVSGPLSTKHASRLLISACASAQALTTGLTMRTRSKLLFTALITALMLTAAVGTASAGRISVSEQGFTSIWPRTEQLNFSGSGLEIECEVTIEGSFHYRTFLKTRSLVGHVTRAIIGPIANCRRNSITEVRVLGTNAEGRLTTPWVITYDSFRGTLPRISGIRLALSGAAFTLHESIFGEDCLYRSTSTEPAFGIVNLNTTTGVATTLTAESGSAIPFSSGGVFCPGSGTFSRNGNVTGRNATGTVTVRLI